MMKELNYIRYDDYYIPNICLYSELVNESTRFTKLLNIS